MFSLWMDIKANGSKMAENKERCIHTNKNFQNVPSPRLNRFAGKSEFLYFVVSFYKTTIKRTRMFISRWGLAEAGMTVEASLVLPLFLMFFINMGSAIEMIRLHSNMELALCDVGRSMSIYGNVLTDAYNGYQECDDPNGMQIIESLGEFALTNLYVKKQLIQYLGIDYLSESPITGGAAGLDLYESNLLDENGFLEIVVTYQVSPIVDIAAFRDFRMMNRYYGHIWSGYELSGDEHPSVVYITENGSVYHESRDCTHLSLSVRRTSMEEVICLRNNNGGRYQSCEKCVQEDAVLDHEMVYVTAEGDCFHAIRECPGLKRTVYTISETRKEEYRPCSRCISRDGE